MLAGNKNAQELARMKSMVSIVQNVLAVVEYTPDGVVLDANDIFLKIMGYRLDEIKGKPHSLFMRPEEAASAEYRQLWAKLSRGEALTEHLRRRAKDGKDVWMRGLYGPIFDSQGRLKSVVKFGNDITAIKNKSLSDMVQVEAINRSQAVVEMAMDGSIIGANTNFLNLMGYGLDEIKGRNHRTLCASDYAAGSEYADLWKKLREGAFHAGEFPMRARDGREVWLQAAYNPVRSIDGDLIKVMAIASDVTRRFEREKMLSQAIGEELGKIHDQSAEVLRDTEVVAGAMTETASMIQSVAAAAEELSASIQEISQRASSSRDSAGRTHDLVRSTDSSAAALAEKAQQMTGIVEMIDAIASQINLLALNATIESARAGEAGRGFAVVASEVKNLAAQVSEATKTIREEITSVQGISETVLSTLCAIQGSVGEISSSITSVVAAVQQQTAATVEISSTMQSAAGAITSAERDVASIAQGMSRANEATEQVRENVRSLVR